MFRHGVLLIISFLSLSFSSCTKGRISQKTQKKLQLAHAQHFDIPVPLTFKQTQTHTEEKQGCLHDAMHYKGQLSVSACSAFYRQEMEKSGWEVIDLSNRSDGFFYCNKPNKHCGIHIQKNSELAGTIITILVSQKVS